MANYEKFFNPVLSREALAKILGTGGKGSRNKKKVSNADTYEELFKYCEKRLPVLVDYLNKKKSESLTIFLKQLPTLVSSFKDFSDRLEMLDDTKAVSRTKTVLRSLDRLKKRLKEKSYKKVSDVWKDLRKTHELAKKIKLDEDRLEYLKEAANVFKSLKRVVLPKKEEPAFIVEAPLLLVLDQQLDLHLKLKLKERFRLKEVIRYSYIEEAKFMVGRKSRLNKKIPIEGQINAIITILNKRLAGNIVPIHDVSIDSTVYYIVWLIPENMAKPVSDLLEVLNDSQILINY